MAVAEEAIVEVGEGARMPTEVVNVDTHKFRGPVDGVIKPLKTDDIMKNYNRY